MFLFSISMEASPVKPGISERFTNVRPSPLSLSIFITALLIDLTIFPSSCLFFGDAW
jgi:hypothetical protein